MSYDVSYRVLATVRRPLFICKAIPNPNPDLKPTPEKKQSTPSNPNLLKIKHQFQNISFRLNLQQSSSKLGNRSMSCELTEEKKNFGEDREKMAGQKGTDRQRQQRRSIKQYLRLAYKRNQWDRRTSSYKLPEIKRDHNQQAEAVSEKKCDLEKVATMKHIMKRVRNSERPKFKSQDKQQWGDHNFGYLSGWDHANAEEQY